MGYENRDEYSTLQKDIGEDYRVCLMKSAYGKHIIRIYPAPFGVFANKTSNIVWEGSEEEALAMYKSIETVEHARKLVMRVV